MAKRTIKATHRLRRPHGVIFDPQRHFLRGMKKGERCELPAGTHVIPRKLELANMPDRFQALRVAGAPAERVIDDDGAPEDVVVTGGDGNDESVEADSGTEEEDEGAQTNNVGPRASVQDALDAVGGDWGALTSSVLQDLAGNYEIADIEGTGSKGAVVKADYLLAVQGAFGVVD